MAYSFKHGGKGIRFININVLHYVEFTDVLHSILQLAISSTPFFEPYAIPLLLEKLSSSLPVAKVCVNM